MNKEIFLIKTPENFFLRAEFVHSKSEEDDKSIIEFYLEGMKMKRIKKSNDNTCLKKKAAKNFLEVLINEYGKSDHLKGLNNKEVSFQNVLSHLNLSYRILPQEEFSDWLLEELRLHTKVYTDEQKLKQRKIKSLTFKARS